MTEETRKQLIGIGRSDLVETHDLIMSGYAGVKSTGEIVDRRTNPDATAMKENSLLGIPKVKDVAPERKEEVE